MTARDTHLTIHPLEGCSTFSTEADIHGIAGVLVADGDRAYDRVRDACAKRTPIRLSGPDGIDLMTVTCHEVLPDRAPWLTLR